MMDAAVNAGGEFQNWTVVKIFPNMTSTPKATTTRQGKQITTPNFWTAFVLLVPEQIAESTNEELVSQQLSNTNLQPYIQYAHPNYLGRLNCGPNDTYYGIEQVSINFTGIPNGILVENAWCKDVVGENHVKVGIYDSGINYSHEDLVDGTGASKVLGGKHYGTNVPTSTLNNPDDFNASGHGTPVAGIIGALRNNSVGIAGIAGGDIDFFNNTGVPLYDFKIFTGGFSVGFDGISRAIIEGAESANNNGFELNLANHSWDVPLYNVTNKLDSINLFQDAYYFAYRSGVVNVASRGNYDPAYSDTIKVYPAGFDADWVISVGGNNDLGNLSAFSLYGNGVDVLAPGADSLAYSLANYYNGTGYRYYTGTSYAAPHASGTAALLLSYWNNTATNEKLYQEDVEHILELSARDIGAPSYDNFNGWGIVQASAALDSIWKDDGFHLIQIPEDGGSETIGSPVLVGSLMDTIFVEDTIAGLLPNTYLGGKYEIDITYRTELNFYGLDERL